LYSRVGVCGRYGVFERSMFELIGLVMNDMGNLLCIIMDDNIGIVYDSILCIIVLFEIWKKNQ
jgi:hypothetical protein